MAETRALLGVLEETLGLSVRALPAAFQRFGKWRKWMVQDSCATDRDKSIIAGHYIFSIPPCQVLLAEASERLDAKGIDLNDYLKDQIKASILRYLQHFNLLRSS